jgi:hypothetical protein
VSRRRSGATRLGAAVIVVAVLAVTVITLVSGDSDRDARQQAAATTTTAAVEATTTTFDRDALGAEAQALLELVDLGRAGTFHARYALSSAELGAGAAAAELEVWRAPDQIRQDTMLTDSTGVVRTAAFAGAAGTIGCRHDGAAWRCEQVTDDAYDPTNDLLAGVLPMLVGAEVASTAATVGPYDARCFTIDGPSVAELCLSPEGVPLRVDAGGTRYEVLEVDAAVTEADFVPPADVVPS